MSHRVVMGRWADGVGSGFGLRCALPGRDAFSADDRDLTFSSDWPEVLPVLQAGTFSLAGNQSLTIGFPDPGFIPHARFLVNGGPETGQAYDPVVPLGVWTAYATMAYRSENGKSALLLNVGRGDLNASFTLYTANGSSMGWPGSWAVAYAVYAVPAA